MVILAKFHSFSHFRKMTNFGALQGSARFENDEIYGIYTFSHVFHVSFADLPIKCVTSAKICQVSSKAANVALANAFY